MAYRVKEDYGMADNTLTTVNHLHADAGDTITLVAHVNKESDNTPVYEGTLTFTVVTTIIGTVNVVNGVATKTWTVPSGWAVDDYTITSQFVGTVNYNTSIGTNTLTLDPPLTTLKPGYDVDTAEDNMVTQFYSLNFDKDEITDPDVPLFDDNRILQGNVKNVTFQSGQVGIFDIGDQIEVEEALRGQPEWGVYDAFLWVIVPGDNRSSKTKRNEIIRIIRLSVDNGSFDYEDFHVEMAEKNSETRMSVSFDKKDIEPEQKNWNHSAMLKFTVKIAKVPST
jgi:hypothetical protein